MEPIPPEAYLAIAAGARHVVVKIKDRRVRKKNEKLRKLQSGSTSTGWTTSTTDASSTSSLRSLEELLDHNGLTLSQDGLVQWSMSSPDHPRNWGTARKTSDVAILLWLTFLMAVGSTVGTSASNYALHDFHVSKAVGITGYTTIYLIGQALAILLFSPYSEAFGRKRVYIASAIIYAIFCIPVAATPNIAAVFIGRFITGVMSAVPIILTRRTIEDLFESEARSWALFVWSLVTNFGLVIGPIFACYIAIALNWRWVFYLSAIIVIATSTLLCLTHETHTALLLDRKVTLVQHQRQDITIETQKGNSVPDLHTVIQLSLLRPCRLFFTQPIVFLATLPSAFTVGLMFLLPAALPIIYSTHPFNFSRQRATLLFLFVLIGLLLSTLTRFYDQHLARIRQRANLPLCPEKKLFGLALGGPLLAISLWWFAWTVPPHLMGVKWPASAVSLILLGYSVSEFDIISSRYLADSYTSHTTTTLSTLSFLRAIFSGIFPLFASPLYTNLNNNTATSILATFATVFCLVPLILITYGKRMRGASRFARETMPREEIKELERVRTEKEEKRREQKEEMRRVEEDALARGVDLGGTSFRSSDSLVRNLSGAARYAPGVLHM